MENIDALGHEWGEPVWNWTGVTAAAATFTCTRDASHVETVNAEITADPNGYAIFTATVTHDGVKFTDTKTAPDAVAKIDSKYYYTIEAAVTDSVEGDVIVLLKSVTQTEDLTIPAGRTLLLPYAPGEETINPYNPDNPSMTEHPYANEAFPSKATLGLTPYGQDVNVMLTLANGKTLTVADGAMLVVGGTLTGNQPITGTTYGLHSEIHLGTNAKIEVDNGAKLSNCGYIIGGSVIAHGHVFEPFVMTDFHGGSVLQSRISSGSTPFNSFALLNIQSDLVIHSDGALQGYAMVNSGNTQFCASALTVGKNADATGLFVLEPGTTMTISYDPNNVVDTYGFDIGKSTFTVNGDVAFTPMTISLMGVSVSTDLVTFGIPYNIDMVQEEGCFRIQSKAAVLPGSTITVKDGAFAVLEEDSILLVLDYFTPNPEGGKPTYPPALAGKRGNLFIDGELTIENGATFAGIAQTHGTGKLIVGDGAVLEGEFTAGGGDQVSHYPLTGRVAMLHEEGNQLYEMGALLGDEYIYYAVNGSTVAVEDQDPVTGTWGIDIELSLNANYGNPAAVTSLSARVGAAVDLPNDAFTREGYSFAGWTEDAAGSGEKLTRYTPAIDGDGTLYAQWTPNMYTVTFMVDGEQYGEPIQVAYGQAIPLPEAPVKEGYTFSGWQNVPDTMPAEDLTVNATWTINRYTVTVETDGNGTASASANEADYNTQITVSAEPSYVGYVFDKWTVDGETVSTEADYTFQLKNNVTLKAHFKLNFDPVAKIGNNYYESLKDAVDAAEAGIGDVIVLLKSVEQSEDLIIPNDVTLLLPYASGEETINDANAKHPYANEKITTGSYRIVGVEQNLACMLTLNNAKLTLNDGAKLIVGGTLGGYQPIGGGTTGSHSAVRMIGSASIEVNSGAILSNTGYITGGTVNVDGGTVYEPLVVTDYHGGTVSVGRITAGSSPFNSYAIMNIQSKTVLTNNAKLNSYAMVYAGSVQNLTTVKTIGTDSDTLFQTSPDTRVTISYDPTTAATISGVDIGKTTFAFEGDLNFKTMKLEYEYGSQVIELNTANVVMAIPFSFNVVQKSGTFTVGSDAVILPGAAVTVEAGADAQIAAGHKLFVADMFEPRNEGGMPTYPAELQNKRGNLFIDGELTIPNGATFCGIAQTHGTGKLIVGDGAVLEGEFTAGGGDQVSHYPLTGRVAMLHEEGNQLYEMGALLGDEYIYYAVNGSTVAVEDQDPVTGTWGIDIELSLNANYGNPAAVTSLSARVGAAVDLPNDAFTREGYSFAGWTEDAAGSGEKLTRYTPAIDGDGTLYAQWTPNMYTVTFMVDGEQYGEPIQVAYGQAIPLPEAPVKEGYTFSGWQNVPDTMPAQDVTITGIFGTNHYTIRWMNGDTTLQTDTVVHGATPEYKGAEPTKEPTNTNVFTFVGWSPEIGPATCDQDYFAVFESAPRMYTVTWIIDGVSEETQYAYGAMPEHVDPTKEADAQYTYSFAGWTPQIVSVTEDASYTATFDHTVNQYNVTWIDGNGETLKVDRMDYGTKPVYVNKDDLGNDILPAKDSTDRYRYVFIGWEPEITDETIVKEDVTYTAVFDEVLRQYTVTFMNGDTVLESKLWDYGATPVYDGTPTKEGDAQYSYSFAGWSPAVEAVTKDAVYYASFQHSTNKYLITWKNYDGSVLKEEEVEYGSVPAYDGTPEKPADEQYTYSFAGWDITPVSVTGPATYTATYSSEIRSYSVTFFDEDGETVLDQQTLAYGTTPVYGGVTPTKEPDEQYSYIFSHWTPNISVVHGDQQYTAVYTTETNKYTVTWVDWNGEVLETDPDVPYGTRPSFDGEAPVKDSDPQYSYRFEKWSPEITDDTVVTGNVTYTAVYSKTLRSYVVTFYDEDRTTILDRQTLDYGSTPVYQGETPTKKADAQYTYTFDGWSPAISEVHGEQNYIAVYSSVTNQYTVTWIDWNGDVLETDPNVDYGTIPSYDGIEPSREQTESKVYTFIGWDPEITDSTIVTGDVTYQAQYEEADRLYTVKWLGAEGEELQVDQVRYNDPVPAFIFEGENGEDLTPVKEADAQYSYSFEKFTPELAEDARVTADISFTAQFTAQLRSYPITWMLDENTLIEVTTVEYGEIPTHEAPVKADDAMYSYSFIGWDPAPTEVTGEATYTAQFSQTLRSFKVTWENWDGSVLETDEAVPYGDTPAYNSAEPTKELSANEVGSYRFIGWDPELTEETIVTEDLIFTASFSFTGWRSDGNGKQYFIDDALQTGWLELDGKQYYLDEESGYAATGLTDIPASEDHNAGKYLFDENGIFRSEFNGVYSDEKTGNIYLLQDGVATEYSGLYRDPETQEYYFFSCNAAVRDQDIVVNAENNNSVQNELGDTLPDDTYFFGSNGVIAHEDVNLDGIETVDGVMYYYIDGIRVYMGMFELDGYYYYADSNGKLIVNRTYWCTKNNDTGFAEGPYSFDEAGRLIIVPEKNGIYQEEGELFYYIDGNRSFAGLLRVDGAHPQLIHYADGTTASAADGYYYVMSNGQLVLDRYFWVSKVNDTGMEPGVYYFDENGLLQIPQKKNGIYAEDGTLFFYENDLRTGNGLIQIAEDTVIYVKADGTECKAAAGYYYILPSGEVINGRSYWVDQTNGLMAAGTYVFDADGRMEEIQQKNGIVEEDGKLYYYVDGVRTYAGLLLIDGEYYYAKAGGEIVCGKSFYVTKTNNLLPAGVYQFDADGRMVNKP